MCSCRSHKNEKADPAEQDISTTDSITDSKHIYRADDFVQDAFSVRITPFMLDSYANEWNELKRAQNAHAIEIDNLRTTNRNLAAQVLVNMIRLFDVATDHKFFPFPVANSKGPWRL